MRQLSLVGQMQVFNGDITYLGTIQSTGTSVTNATTSSAFTIPAGATIVVQADATGYFRPVGTPDTTTNVSATNGFKLAADESRVMTLRSDRASLAWISGSGTTNLKVWQLL